MALNPLSVLTGTVRAGSSVKARLSGGATAQAERLRSSGSVAVKRELVKRRATAVATGGSGAPGETGEPQGGYPTPLPFTLDVPEPITGPTDVVSPGGGMWSNQNGPFGGLANPGHNGSPGGTGIGGIQIGPGGITATGTIAGIPISGTLPFGGSSSGSEAPAGPSTPGGGECPGIFSIRDPVTGNCINLDALPPGGDPAMTGSVQPSGGSYADGYGAAVKGYYGVGLMPRVEVQTVRRCPPGMALGKDGVCYEGLGRNSPKRRWPMGMKPLLTPGERRAIRIATSAAGKLARAKKGLKKAGKALEKVC